MRILKVTSALALAASFGASAPARADLKDAIIGVGIGAIATGIIRDQNNRRSGASNSARSTASSSQFSRSERRQIQASLNALGYDVGVVDGSLGRRSREGIRQFQIARGEQATGRLTRAQFAALVNAQTNPNAAFVVDRALDRNEIRMMQQGLQALGYYRMRVDGSNGPGTRRARDNFLRAQGYNPAATTQVQAAVLAISTAGGHVPPYLMQEAQTQYQQANAPVTAPPGGGMQQPKAALFGTPQPQQGLAQPQQPGLFGAQPASPQGANAQGGQTMALFGAPSQAQGAPQQQNALFGAAPVQPQGVAPQTQQGTALFGAQPQMQHTAPAQAAPKVNPLFAPSPAQQGGTAPAAPGSASPGGLDVYAMQPPAPQANAPGQQVLPLTASAPQTGQQAAQPPTNALFATPTSGFGAVTVSTADVSTNASQAGGLDVFSAPTGAATGN